MDKYKIIKIYSLILTLALLGLVSATAQTQLKKSVVGNGGTQASGGGMRLSGTVGQAFIGPSQSRIAQLNAGFWNRVDCELIAEAVGGTISTCSNQTVVLMGNANQQDVSYSWIGPDGFTSDLQNPEVSVSGNYVLTVTAPDGCTSIALIVVGQEVEVTPVAGFSYELDGIDVSFTDQSTFEPTSWFWDFGNGDVSTEQNPTFRYLTGGEYEVCLTAKNNCGEDVTCLTVSIDDPVGATTFIARPRTEGPSGVMLDVPISVENFTDVASFQMTIHVGDPSIVKIVGVEGFVLPDLDENDFFQIDDGTVTVAWYYGPGATVLDNRVIFRVKVMLLAEEEICTPIFINNDPTFVEVGVFTPDRSTIVSAPYKLVSGEICVLPNADVFGQIYRETQDPLKDVTVECTDQDPVVTGQDGLYQFLGLKTGNEYVIDPSRNTNPLEGVSAIDLALITRHIQTLEILNSPYKIIAADVDHSNTVGAIDLANIQQLILRKTTEFAEVDSWRFVDAAFEFPDPANPLVTPFPETIVLESLLEDISDADFIGMKLGDVNGTARGFIESIADEMAILIAEQNNGNVTTVEFRAADLQTISAYQFDINFDPAQMQLEEIIPGVLPGLNQTFFSTEKAADGVISTLWYDPTGNPDGLQLDPDDVLFSLQFRVKPKAKPIQERIWTGDRVLKSAGYTEKGETLRIGSFYENDLKEGLDQALRQIRLNPLSPNPFDEQTNLSFYLPEAADVQIEVRDALGRMVKAINENYAPGNHQIRIESSELGGQGLYLVKMKSGDFSATRKIILQQR